MAPSGWQLCISDPLHTCPLPLCLCENIGRQRRLQQAVSARKREETETPDRAAKRRLENAASTRKCTPLQSAQKDTDIHVREIATDILQRRDIDGETLQFISSPEFHQASSACPFVFPLLRKPSDAFVFNDETLQGDEGVTVRARLVHALDAPPGVEEATRCQTSVREHDSASAPIWFCASCNRKIEQNE